MTQMCWLTPSHPYRHVVLGSVRGVGAPWLTQALPSATWQTRAPPGAWAMAKGQLAIAASTSRGARLAPVPHGARATQTSGFRFSLLL